MTVTPEEARDVFYTSLNNAATSERGWGFHVGDPEVFHFRDRLFVPGGEVLDLGCDSLRASLCFAMWGMRVDGYDKDSEGIEYASSYASAVKKVIPELDLRVRAQVADLDLLALDSNRYDVVLLGQSLVHYDNKQKALAIVDKALTSLKPKGHIWIRTVGKADDQYRRFADGMSYTATKVDDDVYLDLCDCTGTVQMDPFLFFDPVELPLRLLQHGCRIVHSQVMPSFGKKNVMYGEDWHTATSSYSNNGMISVLAQKAR